MHSFWVHFGKINPPSLTPLWTILARQFFWPLFLFLFTLQESRRILHATSVGLIIDHALIEEWWKKPSITFWSILTASSFDTTKIPPSVLGNSQYFQHKSTRVWDRVLSSALISLFLFSSLLFEMMMQSAGAFAIFAPFCDQLIMCSFQWFSLQFASFVLFD